MTILRDKRTMNVIVQPIDLATRLKEMRQEREKQQLFLEQQPPQHQQQPLQPFRSTEKVLQ
jgi:hypothetical protein